MKAAIFILPLLLLTGCKTAQKCDAYSMSQYDYIQVLGYTDIVPTFGEDQLHLPPGDYIIKAWKGEDVVYIKMSNKLTKKLDK